MTRKHTVGRWGTVCSISTRLIPSVTSVRPVVRAPRQSCVNRGSTVVITARSDETHCLRVRGEVCQLDCTLCSRCWLWGKLSREGNERQTRRETCACVCCMYLKELRWWNCTTGFLAPCNHVLREKCLVEEEEVERGRQTGNISHCDNNYGVGICDRKRNVMQISLARSSVIIFCKNTKRRETLCRRTCL